MTITDRRWTATITTDLTGTTSAAGFIQTAGTPDLKKETTAAAAGLAAQLITEVESITEVTYTIHKTTKAHGTVAAGGGVVWVDGGKVMHQTL